MDTTDPDNVKFANVDAVNAYLGVSNIYAYVSAGHPVVAYHFTGLSGPDCIYYLDFGGNESKANAFYVEYFGANSDQIREYADNYVNNSALEFGSDYAWNVRGDMYVRSGGDLQVRQGTINTLWNGAGNQFFDQFANYATDYKALQLDLEKNVKGMIIFLE